MEKRVYGEQLVCATTQCVYGEQWICTMDQCARKAMDVCNGSVCMMSEGYVGRAMHAKAHDFSMAACKCGYGDFIRDVT